MFMLKRFPPLSSILPTFAVIAFMFYAWSLSVFIYKLPGWLSYLHPAEIGGILAYEFAVNFAESSVFLLILLLVCAALPARFLKHSFVVRGTVIAVVMIASMQVFLYRFFTTPQFGIYVNTWMLASAAFSILAAWVSTRVRFIQVVVLWLSDRLIIFLFLLIPCSVLSLLYMLLHVISI